MCEILAWGFVWFLASFPAALFAGMLIRQGWVRPTEESER